MAKFPPKQKAEKESKGNILADPEQRKKFKTMLATITEYFRKIDDIKDGMSETVADTATQYGVDKKTVRRLAKTMYSSNYSSLLEENRHFETLYETIIEGKLRDPDDHLTPDPLEDTDE